MRERRRDYELLFIIPPIRIGDEEIHNAIERVSQAITNLGGVMTAINHAPPWGRRKFAYPIRAYVEGEASRRVFTEGYYVLMHFQMATDRVAELERLLKLNDSVLRYLLTLVETRGAARSTVAPVKSFDGAEPEDEDFEEDEEELDVEDVESGDEDDEN
ncbi:MAG: 30S ribosomal protein S6 [Roseiflexus castenholzii]|uniref:30S ribosomal protein S6 n=1 Tax=Roseiflexus castenholzii TaxID=120962 RepID=UPI000CAB052A|nr:MAG: 30S ribosomal protein S6 [Roseiflexus castenholzii]